MPPSARHNKIEVRFELSHFNDLSHEEISCLLGLEPSRAYIKGQPYSPRMGRLVTENR